MFNFLTNNQIPFGLDINDRSLKIAKAKQTAKGIQLVSCGRVDIPEGIISRGVIQKTDELIKVLKEMSSSVKGETLGTKKCICALAESETFLKVVEMPLLQESEMQEAIKWGAEANFPFRFDQMYLDWQTIEPIQKKPDKIQVLITALPRDLADSYFSILTKAGLEPLVFGIEAAAIARSTIKDDYAEKPQLILDLGFRRSSAIIFSGHSIYFTVSFPFSIEQLVTAIVKEFGVSFDEAIELKDKFGLDSSLGNEKISNILVSKIDELILNARAFIDFYEERPSIGNPNEEKIAKILLCGGGASIPNISKYLAEKIGVAAEVCNPLINYLPTVNSKIIPNRLETFTTAFGLAIRGAKNF